jgi:hypothetical protein
MAESALWTANSFAPKRERPRDAYRNQPPRQRSTPLRSTPTALQICRPIVPLHALQIHRLPQRRSFAYSTPDSRASESRACLRQSGGVLHFPHMAPKKASLKEIGEMLAHVVKHMATKEDIAAIRKEVQEGFSAVNRRLDQIIQMQLDEHAGRIKKLETAVFPK